MWKYDFVSREDFETIMEKVESFIVMLGGKKVSENENFPQRVITHANGDVAETITRTVYKYKDEYYRVDEIHFDEKPFIVIEYASHDDFIHKRMWDADPFPYDLSENELLMEVKYALEIEPYPEA